MTLMKDREIKFYDTSFGSTALVNSVTMAGAETDPTTILTISAPAVGDGDQNRDGKKITIHGVQVTGNISYAIQVDQTTADVAPVVDLWVLLDKQSNGAQFNSEDVFTNPSGVACQPLRNLGFNKRFRILKHKHFPAPILPITYDGTNIEQSGSTKSFNFFLRFKKPLIVNFSAGSTAAGIASVIDNSIHVMAVGSLVAAVIPSLAYNARIRFVG